MTLPTAPRLAFGLLFAVAMVGLSFFVLSITDASPHSPVRTAVTVLNAFPGLVGLLVATLSGGNVHDASFVVIVLASFAQWFLVGLLVSPRFASWKQAQ
jgi:hypothetical protein